MNNRHTVNTIEELVAYFQECVWWGGKKDKFKDPTYLACKQAIEKGFPVHFGTAGDEEDEIERVVCNYGIMNCKGIEIIQGEGGY